LASVSEMLSASSSALTRAALRGARARLGLASRGRDLELDLQRAQLVASRLRLHLVLERVVLPEVQEGGAWSPVFS
jgi:hypothetical protein